MKEITRTVRFKYIYPDPNFNPEESLKIFKKRWANKGYLVIYTELQKRQSLEDCNYTAPTRYLIHYVYVGKRNLLKYANFWRQLVSHYNPAASIIIYQM